MDVRWREGARNELKKRNGVLELSYPIGEARLDSLKTRFARKSSSVGLHSKNFEKTLTLVTREDGSTCSLDGKQRFGCNLLDGLSQFLRVLIYVGVWLWQLWMTTLQVVCCKSPMCPEVVFPRVEQNPGRSVSGFIKWRSILVFD